MRSVTVGTTGRKGTWGGVESRGEASAGKWGGGGAGGRSRGERFKSWMEGGRVMLARAGRRPRTEWGGQGGGN